ncbi:hypothetical protein DSO57_1034832 [Entomophthora muscae]|uniref:Uncharacterized protein n=1 Tax=Entomophthora muscae TaxID=34485 RepID=A0ACC2S1U5_9FUNG|nr:hypothetical protein DSO57_1034832 [Entomophthora muscae]
MSPPLTPQPDLLLEPTAAAKTPSTQLFGVLYITLNSLVDSVVPNSGPWSILGQSVSYIIKLAPILWWALPASSTAPHSKLQTPLPTTGFLTCSPDFLGCPFLLLHLSTQYNCVHSVLCGPLLQHGLELRLVGIPICGIQYC